MAGTALQLKAANGKLYTRNAETGKSRIIRGLSLSYCSQAGCSPDANLTRSRMKQSEREIAHIHRLRLTTANRGHFTITTAGGLIALPHIGHDTTLHELELNCS